MPQLLLWLTWQQIAMDVLAPVFSLPGSAAELIKHEGTVGFWVLTRAVYCCMPTACMYMLCTGRAQGICKKAYMQILPR